MSRIKSNKPSKKKKLSSYQRRKTEIFELQAIRAKLDTLLEVSKNIMSEMYLLALLERIMEDVTVVMNADRSTLFLVDFKTNECYSYVAQGTGEIRFPVGTGLAGFVAQTGETINIPEAYEDERFNPEFDKKSGYRTKTILTMPLKTNTDKIIGVTQVLNKRGRDPFNKQDEDLLAAFSSLAAIAVQNAQLYEEVLNEKNYNDSILTNIPSAVLTINTDGLVITANSPAFEILGASGEKFIGHHHSTIFAEDNKVLHDTIEKAMVSGDTKQLFDVEYVNQKGKASNINLNAKRLSNSKDDNIGTLVVIEDVTAEKRMKSTLSQYMSKEVAEQVLNNEMSLEGKRQNVTILFSDIRNFTSLSEKSQPEEVVNLLNGYFDIMIDIIFKHEGILDKFIGDAIMAVYGAPIIHEDDPSRAVRTAVEMICALKHFNEMRQSEGLVTIDIGIGINSGEAVVGNVGSEKRMEYTVIGDTVNLASRLEGLTKQFPNKIIVSEFVYEEVKNEFEFDYLDEVQVKGKNIPVKIYGVKDKYFC